jgi:hypothetical protein
MNINNKKNFATDTVTTSASGLFTSPGSADPTALANVMMNFEMILEGFEHSSHPTYNARRLDNEIERMINEYDPILQELAGL